MSGEKDRLVPINTGLGKYGVATENRNDTQKRKVSQIELAPNRDHGKRRDPPKHWFHRAREAPVTVLVVVFIAILVSKMTLNTLVMTLPSLLVMLASNDTAQPAANITAHLELTPPSYSEALSEFSEAIWTTLGNNKTTQETSVILAVYSCSQVIIFPLLVGAIVHSFGHKWPFVIGVGMSIVFLLCYVAARVWWVLVIASVIGGVAFCFTFGAGMALIAAKFVAESERTIAFCIVGAAQDIGCALADSLGAFLIVNVGITAPFWLLIAFMIVDGVGRLLIKTNGDKDALRRHKDSAPVTHYFRTTKDILVNRRVLLLLGWQFFSSLCVGAFHSSIPFWMLTKLRAEQWEVGAVLLVSLTVEIIATFTAGVVGNVVENKRWIFMLCSIMAVGISMVFMPFVKNGWILLIPLIVFRCGIGINYGIYYAWTSSVADKLFDRNYESMVSISFILTNIGYLCGSLLCGVLLVPVLGLVNVFIPIGVITACFSVTSLYLRELE